MAAEDGSNGVWRGDKEGHYSSLIASSLCETAEQKAGRPRKYVSTFLITNDKTKTQQQALPLPRIWYCFQQYKRLHNRLDTISKSFYNIQT